MTDPAARTFSSDFKRFFVRGLVILLPSVLTLWIVVKAYQFIDSSIAQPINGGVRLALVKTAPVWEPLRSITDPNETELMEELGRRLGAGRKITREQLLVEMRQATVARWWEDRWYMDLIGLVVAIVAVYIAGRLLGGFFGRSIYARIERFITSLPVFKQVYPYVKQIVDFLFSDDSALKFNRVVVVEYPRKGIWSVGFMTGGTMRAIATHSGDSVTVFIPSSPTPFTGYTITVPRNEVIDVPITVDEALRFVVSGGVLVPTTQLVPGDALPPAERKAIRSAVDEAIRKSKEPDVADEELPGGTLGTTKGGAVKL
jgi:uncharacterized membrane protein